MAKKTAKTTVKKPAKKPIRKAAKKAAINIGDYVIARSRDAGVWCGTLASVDPATATVTLTGARQMWYWQAKESVSLLSVAEMGVVPDKCRFSLVAKRCAMCGCCAIVAVSPAARATLEAANAKQA